MNFGKTPASIRSLAPRLGQHSEEVLLEAGFSQAEVDAMIASGEARLPQD
jgi:crotonobetainyl-CoA:carnitine CoA-transferase CaiB-like acyl-CoA transferase